MSTTDIPPNTSENKLLSTTTSVPKIEDPTNGTSTSYTTDYLTTTIQDNPSPSYHQIISTTPYVCSKADESFCLGAGTVVGLMTTSFVMGIIFTFVVLGLIWKRSKLLNHRLKNAGKKLDSSLNRTATYKKRLTSDYTSHQITSTKIDSKRQNCGPSLMNDPNQTEAEEICKRPKNCSNGKIDSKQTAAIQCNSTDSIYSSSSEVKRQLEMNRTKTGSIYCNTLPGTIYSKDIMSPFPESQRGDNHFNSDDVYVNNERNDLEIINTMNKTKSQKPEQGTEAVYINKETKIHQQNVEPSQEAIYINQESYSQDHFLITDDGAVETAENKFERKDSNVYNHLGDSLEEDFSFRLYDHTIIGNQKRNSKGIHEKHEKRRDPKLGLDDALYDHATTGNDTRKQNEAYEEVDLESYLERRNYDGNLKQDKQNYDAQNDKELSENVEKEHDYFILEPTIEWENDTPNRTDNTGAVYFELEMNK